MSWNLVPVESSGAIFKRAGIGANVGLSGTDIITRWMDQAESTISMRTRKDWVADFSDVTANFQDSVKDAAEAFVARRIVAWDMSGFLNRLEAQTVMDLLTEEFESNIRDLNKQEHKDLMEP